MNGNINCIYNEKGAWCTNKNNISSFLGMKRRCQLYPYGDMIDCKHREKHPRPKMPTVPPPPKSRK